ncbi:hypothetical protein P5673_010268 [Acropora cervicornis]|uniref:Uncharacterized protein n=1 Tax=Acropora cervicornis TaxID=6130 RepID=A0AAD9QRD2_ACRCE|nr:hypothetical protein P5673_010268 [Acropora cervicornis]
MTSMPIPCSSSRHSLSLLSWEIYSYCNAHLIKFYPNLCNRMPVKRLANQNTSTSMSVSRVHIN